MTATAQPPKRIVPGYRFDPALAEVHGREEHGPRPFQEARETCRPVAGETPDKAEDQQAEKGDAGRLMHAVVLLAVACGVGEDEEDQQRPVKEPERQVPDRNHSLAGGLESFHRTQLLR